MIDAAKGYELFAVIELSIARDEHFALRLTAADKVQLPAVRSAWRVTSLDYPAIVGEGKADVVVCLSQTNHKALDSSIVFDTYAKRSQALPCSTEH